MQLVEQLTCSPCEGKGYTVERGFNGRERVACGNCDGKGTIDYVTPDWDAFEREHLDGLTAVEYNAMVAAEDAATIGDVAAFLGVAVSTPKATPMPLTVHSGMTAEFFDTGVRRAFANELSISRTDRPGVVAVSSTSDADISYLVTCDTCTCVGHDKVGRCLHRAFAIWHWWVLECDAAALAASAPAAPVIALQAA